MYQRPVPRSRGHKVHKKARSSGVERYLDTVEVGGSKPPAPNVWWQRPPSEPLELEETEGSAWRTPPPRQCMSERQGVSDADTVEWGRIPKHGIAARLLWA